MKENIKTENQESTKADNLVLIIKQKISEKQKLMSSSEFCAVVCASKSLFLKRIQKFDGSSNCDAQI